MSLPPPPGDILECPSLIGGAWAGAGGGGWLEVRNPSASTDLVAKVPRMDPTDVERAVAAAGDAFDGWRRLGRLERGKLLLGSADQLSSRADSTARLISREIGKTIAEAEAEVAAAVDFLRFYGGLGFMPEGSMLPHSPDARAHTRSEPLGVVLAIAPWNDPLLTPARKLCPALLAGNTTVLKPASDAPLSALAFARALDVAGVPAGVVNVVTGLSSEVGEALLDGSDFAAVSFTGSNAVGDRLSRTLAGTVPTQLEMGGKNATVVLDDGDVELAVDAIIKAGFAQAGQRCTATSRVVAQSKIADELIDRLVERAGAITCGPATAPRTEMGPVASLNQQQEILAVLERALESGSQALTGGQKLVGDDLDNGYFIAPTIFADQNVSGPVWNEEIFGPVLGVVRIGGVDEAIEAVNDSRYGLSASIFSNDLGAVEAFVDRVEVGQVAVNLPTSGWSPHLPFGGFKESGSGAKEQGVEALSFFSRTKTVAMRPGRRDRPVPSERPG